MGSRVNIDTGAISYGLWWEKMVRESEGKNLSAQIEEQEISPSAR
jgi:hypothetical protein